MPTEYSVFIDSKRLTRFAFSGLTHYDTTSQTSNWGTMMGVGRVIAVLLRAFFRPRAALAAEILALYHQPGVLQHSVKRPRLRQRDRIFRA